MRAESFVETPDVNECSTGRIEQMKFRRKGRKQVETMMKRLRRRESQLKKVRCKKSLNLLALKRAVMLQLCILVGRFSLFLQ
jgi:hypothetical protein